MGNEQIGGGYVETVYVPRVITRVVRSANGGSNYERIKSTPALTINEKKANDRLAVFVDFLFTHIVFDITGVVVTLRPTVLIDHIKEIFASVLSTTNQAGMIERS